MKKGIGQKVSENSLEPPHPALSQRGFQKWLCILPFSLALRVEKGWDEGYTRTQQPCFIKGAHDWAKAHLTSLFSYFILHLSYFNLFPLPYV
jgi:hypothetical protein